MQKISFYSYEERADTYFNQLRVFESWLLSLQDRSANVLVAEKWTHWFLWRVLVLFNAFFLVFRYLYRSWLLNLGCGLNKIQLES